MCAVTLEQDSVTARRGPVTRQTPRPEWRLTNCEQRSMSEEHGPFVVVGWSYGGMVTQAFAQRHRDVTADLSSRIRQ